jgi:hypothetical protein
VAAVAPGDEGVEALDAVDQARECKMCRPTVKTQRLTDGFSYARLGSHAPTQSQLRGTTTN